MGAIVRTVYVLCALISVACAAALLLIYWNPRRRPGRLMMWASVCLAWFAVSNTLMVVDLVGSIGIPLTVARAATACIGAFALLFGLVWEAP